MGHDAQSMRHKAPRTNYKTNTKNVIRQNVSDTRPPGTNENFDDPRKFRIPETSFQPRGKPPKKILEIKDIQQMKTNQSNIAETLCKN